MFAPRKKYDFRLSHIVTLSVTDVICYIYFNIFTAACQMIIYTVLRNDSASPCESIIGKSEGIDTINNIVRMLIFNTQQKTAVQ